MSIIKRNALLSFVALFPMAVAMTPLAFAAPEGEVVIWNDSVKLGQWRAFGLGVLDSRVAEGGAGMSLDVNWDTATFGVGAAFEQTEAGGVVLPALGEYQGVRFEARAVGEEARTVTVEWVVRPTNAGGREKAFRAAEGSVKTLTGEWVEYEFHLHSDFPRIDASLGEVNALRLLFPKSGSEGRGRVEFRKVRLVK